MPPSVNILQRTFRAAPPSPNQALVTRRKQHRLDARDSRIHTQEYRDRLSGSKFIPAEHRRLARELNH